MPFSLHISRSELFRLHFPEWRVQVRDQNQREFRRGGRVVDLQRQLHPAARAHRDRGHVGQTGESWTVW